MKYLLDTDHISILQNRTGPEFARLSARVLAVNWSELCVCVVSFHEQSLGIHSYLNRAKSDRDLVRGYEFFDTMLEMYALALVLPFDAAAAAMADDLRRQRVRIGMMDLRIASIALVHRVAVLTRNRRDFGRVPGLVIDDWTV